jgi:rhomboid protease GluP
VVTARPSPPVPWAACLLAASIVLAWLLVASLSGRPPWTAQPSRLLLDYGAVDGATLSGGGWWRLLASQWLHVQPLHMLFNAAGVLVAAWRVERAAGWAATVAVYVVCGTAAQLVGTLAHPELVSSGASQAMLALAAAGLVLGRVATVGRAATAVLCAIVAAQLGLDVLTAGTIKPGHLAGLATGLAAGGAILALGRRSRSLSR